MPKQRVLITSDAKGKWYVRRIKTVEHDIDDDEKVYRCDMPVGGACDTPEEAIVVAKNFIGD